MADIRTKIMNNAAPHLQPGETAITGFPTQTKPWWWMLLGGVIFVATNNYRTVVVTDRRVLVFDSGKWSTTKAKTLLHETPAPLTMAEPGGLWHTATELGEPLQVHKRFHKDLAMASGVTA